MNSKQILLVGGGSLFGAVAAVALMKALPSGDDEPVTPEPVAKAPAKVSPAERSENEDPSPPDQATEFRETLREAIEEANPDLDLDELASRQDEFRNVMRERQMERLNSKMAKWSAALGLDKGQQEKLLDIANSQFDELEQMGAEAAESDDPAALSESAQRAMAILSGRALEDSLAEVLTPSQQEAYREFGERQNENRAEARALRQLAGLQEDLMLTPEQRTAVYGILYENAAQEVSGQDDVSALIDSFSSSAGVNLDPSLQGMLSSLANRGLAELASGRELNRESLQELAEGAVTESLEARVDQLRPVLNEGQLQLYREQLESRLGTLMQRGRQSPDE